MYFSAKTDTIKRGSKEIRLLVKMCQRFCSYPNIGKYHIFSDKAVCTYMGSPLFVASK